MKPAQRKAGRDAGRRPRRRSFLAYALGSVAVFYVAARATTALDGPQWLAATLLAAGLALAVYYLVRQLGRWRGGGRL